MVQKSKKLKPLWVLLCVVCVDRSLALEALRDYTIGPQDVDYVSYQQAPLVFESLNSRRTDGRKIAFVLGSSRSNAFGAASKEYQTYNFSAAMACPSHYAYWLERASMTARPDLVLLETDPLQLSTAVADSSLAYGYDAAFVLRHVRPSTGAWPEGPSFSFQEATRFIRKRMFFVDRFPAAPMNLWRSFNARLKGDDPAFRNRSARLLLESYARQHRGVIPSDQFRMSATEDDLRRDLRRFEKYMVNFRLSSTQTGFLLSILQTCERKGIPVVLYRAMAASAYRQAETRYGLDEPANKLREIALQMKYIRYLDPFESPEIKCRRYIDAVHLQGDCIVEQDAYLFSEGRRIPSGTAP